MSDYFHGIRKLKNEERNEHNFSSHSTDDQRLLALLRISRNEHKELANLITRWLPHCRERQIALTKIEESMFWTNAGISRLLFHAEEEAIEKIA